MNLAVLGLCGRSVFLGVEHFHRPGETVHASSLYAEPGGKGFNQAVAAARLGARVSFFTCVGDDADGRECLSFLEQEGVRPVAQVCSRAATACAAILTDRTGENRVTVYQGAAGFLDPAFIRQNEAVIAGSDMVLLNNEYPLKCNLAALELAEAHGVPVLLNPAPAREMDPALLKRFFLVTPNLSEAALLLGEAVPDLKRLPSLFRAHGVSRAVVTLGGDGALLVDGDTALRFPARRARALDTTGAGDTFTAAAAVALLEGKDLPSAVEYAVNASFLCVSKRYVMPALPTREELEANMIGLTPIKMEC